MENFKYPVQYLRLSKQLPMSMFRFQRFARVCRQCEDHVQTIRRPSPERVQNRPAPHGKLWANIDLLAKSNLLASEYVVPFALNAGSSDGLMFC